jgi:hypothetical protein
MAEAFKLGGWGMYPTLVFGILFLGSAIWYAVSPERRRLLLPGVMSLVTLGSGFLGFFTGLIATANGAAEMPNAANVAMIGFAESLHNVCFALTWFVLSGLVLAVGAFRAGRQKPEPAHAGTPVEARG